MNSFLKKHWVGIALLSFTLFGLFLRLYRIDFQCPNWEEVYTRGLAITNASHIINFTLTVECNPPLYYLIVHWFSQIFSASITVLRFPSAIFGTLLIPVAFYIGKGFKDEIVGLLCAFSITVTYSMIMYSQIARVYTLAMLMFGIGTYYFICIWNGNNSILEKLLLVIFFTVAIWSHFYTVVPIGLCCLALLYKLRLKIIPYVLVIVIGCIPFVTYFTTVLPTRMHETYGAVWWQIAYVMPFELLWVPSIFLIPLVVYSVYKNRNNTLLVLFGMISFVTCVLCVCMAQLTPVFPRYALPIVPMLFAVAFCPVSDCLKKFDRERQFAIILALLFGIAACSYTALVAWYFMGSCFYT